MVVKQTMASQQLQGTMLHELQGAWLTDAWRDAQEATVGRECSAVG